MGGTESNEDGSKTVVSTAKDGTTTAVTTSADGCTVTTVVTKPDGSTETTTEIVTTTETEVDVTQQQQGASPTAAAAARAVADFESVSEEKRTAQSLAELAWHAWSASATATAMGVKEATAERLRELNTSSGRKKEDFKRWLPDFLTYVTSHGRRFETVTAVELFIFARAFCRFHVLKYEVDQEEEKQKSLAERALALAGRRSKERKVAWELARAFTLYYPDFPIGRRGLRFSKTNAVLMDQAHVESESSFDFISLNRRLSKWLQKVIVISLLRDPSEDCTRAANVIVLCDGEVVRSGSWSEIIKYVQELGVRCPSQKDVAMCLSDKKATAALFDQSDSTTTSTTVVRLADEVVIMSGSPIVHNVASSKQHGAAEKSSLGAFMYEIQSGDSSSDESDDEQGFDAGEWLMSWFQQRTHSPPPHGNVKTEVFRSEEADGSIVTKTVRTTTRTETSPAGELVTTIEVETTTETETKGGAKSTTVETETTAETATETAATTRRCSARRKPTAAS
ncbi:hypothetical protein PHYSODRAFT_520947 [Phytophthora sojae]|uniref:Uncharacterized protein n=1 Tax=Phytophthora sojae (strain P6497) TaxID=1094619 RepID=G5A2A3_PHYSP|nr:hypothetical protein PHYSODRAFT_520947 [Phytophthora sojae]EGZ11051.1 hypothetical protein PHYSODRAFT_520947 [Phytophthora sojae]|eukprot:XP_009533796.1 hypothetical protein PHYSODRAFT_520947 [Phytophthora sojae]